jgi:hypothetical protein
MKRTRIALLASLLGLAAIGHAENPVIQTKFTADPAPMVWNDTVFLYTGHDDDSASNFLMKDWLLYTSTDLVNWRDRGAVATLKNFKWAGTNGAWAAQTILRNGKFYMYAPVQSLGIGVMVSNTPYGPWTDPLGKPIVNNGQPAIDPTVFIDDDGQAYLYWGNPDDYWVKLNTDMISYSGSINMIPRIQSYQEGPWFYKRGSYYYMAFASTCCPEGIGYAMATSPTGPWTYKGSIMDGNSNSSGNHPGIIDFKGKSYVFGFNYAINYSLTTVHRERRSVCLAQMNYNTDGTIQKVPWWGAGMPSGPGVAQVGTLDPYAQVEAETMAWSKGVQTEPCSEGGMDVTSIHNGDFIKIKGADFGVGATSFDARVASSTSGGSIELRLDSAKGKLVGTVAVAGTGGAQTWATKSCPVTGAAGIHDLFLVFTGSGTSTLFNFNWWKFSGTPTAVAPKKPAGNGEWLNVTTTSNRLAIQSDLPLDRIELVSARGQVRMVGTGTRLDWNTQGFQPGVYFLKARSGASTEIRKLLLNP